MAFLKRLFSAIFLLSFIMAFMGHGDTRQAGNDKKPSTPGERSVLRNQYGAPIQDARGERINYTRDQIRFQASQVQRPDSRHTGNRRNSVKQVTVTPALWGYSAFGTDIGDGGMVVDTVGGRREIYLDAHFWLNADSTASYWYTLYYNHSKNAYEQGFVSTNLSSNYLDSIIALRLGDVTGDSGKEIVVAMKKGSIHLYDQAAKSYLKEVTTVENWATDLEIADVDNDGQNELILGGEYGLYVYSASGTLEWDLDIPARDIVVGQMDNDSGLEIAVSPYWSDDNGYVIDCSSRTIQWTWPTGYNNQQAAVDIDNDNRDELIVAESWDIIYAYDVELQLPKWSITTNADQDAIYMADIDNDSVVELLLGEGQWGSIIAYDTVTLNQEWSINNPEHGVTGIAVADVDGDGQSELMWGAGYSSSGEDIFYIANWQAGQIEWESFHLDGPFTGPECGDLDGDGIVELVVVSFESKSGYSSGRILVFNTNGNLRGISDPIVDGCSLEGTRDLNLYDVDRDGKLEILVPADHWYDGVIEIYDFNTDNTFTLNWTNVNRPDDGFNCAAAGDIDGDGELEIIGGAERYIYAFDYNTGFLEWQSLYHSSGRYIGISTVEVSDVDNDGDQEIISMVNEGDVYIFNGRTKVLDTIIFGPYTALTLINPNQTPPSLALGSEDGNIKIITYSGGDYQTVFNKNYSSESIDGISRLSTSEELIFGTNSTLNIADTSGIIWTSAAYGSPYGKRAVIPDGSSYIFSAGLYSVNAFEYLPGPAPTITVTSPNGGENWEVNSQQTLTWTSTGTVDNVKIEYSTNNGGNWTTITASTSNDGEYLWTVPDAVSNQCLIRVSDTDGSPSDTSDNVFSIFFVPTITVTSPNGYENWQAASVHNITWTSTGTVGNVKIEYSTNKGDNWTEITPSTENDGSFPWTLPDVDSNQCKIRVSETDGSPTDTSDNVFTIFSPSITVTSPNGGENWMVNSQHPITWTSVGTVGNVKIEYSINGDWTEITPSTGNDGSFPWTIPDTVSDQCLIRVSEIDGSPSDTSDVVFSIIPISSITVTSPNGGEQWQVGSQQTITWTSEGNVGNVRIEYSTNGGNSWGIIAQSTENDGSYNWNVPATPSDNCLVRVSETDEDGGPSDISDAVFSIVSPVSGSITLRSPNGGETWLAGSTQQIRWNSTGDINQVNIKYSTDNGTTWKKIAQTTANDGIYNWVVPAAASDRCLVRVTANDSDLDPKPSDVSDAVFSIVLPPSPTIRITAPNGGEQLVKGSWFTITWDAANTREDVRIEYSINGGQNWREITAAAENNGKYDWTVPDAPSDNCLVRISETGGQLSDVSDALFSIVSPTPGDITVTSPNGGETWTAGSSREIKWTAAGIDQVMIEYSKDHGTTWETIIQTTPNSGSFDWIVPGIASDVCLVRITSNDASNDPIPADISDAVFSIVPHESPTITVIAPNGGEQLIVGSSANITWHAVNSREDVIIEYSVNSGDTWTIIAEAVDNNGDYEWLVPDTPSETCLVRVSEIDGQPLDISDAVFSIVEPVPGEITVISPNGGESWTVGSLQEIKWTAGGINNVTIEFSTDYGTTWQVIVQTTENDGSFDWTIPDIVSDECLVRVSANDGDPDPVPSDISDQVFSIIPDAAGEFRVTSPNGGESWEVGSTQSIKWTNSGDINSVMIEYSYDNGNTWNIIVSSVSNSGTYDWQVPDTVSEECLVRVSANDGEGDPKPSDTSDAEFSIVLPPSPTIRVITPNGGEELVIGTQYEITWFGTDSRADVKIEYSINGGETWTLITSSTENDGDFDWLVPDEPSETCLVRISEIDGQPVDVSDAVFSIVQPQTGDLTVFTPNGGENLETGSEYNISWTCSGLNNVIIEYSVNNGAAWLYIDKVPADNGSYLWTIPGTPSDNCLVRVTGADSDENPSDVSNGVFTIFDPSQAFIEVLTPNGGENLAVGEEYYITWASSGINNVFIEYSTNNGEQWNPIDTVPALGGRFTWTVPNTPSDTCLIRISAVPSGEPLDISDAVFSITSN